MIIGVLIRNEWLLLVPSLLATIIATVYTDPMNYMKLFGESSYLLGLFYLPSVLLMIKFYKT
jgi:hypothetical protein